MKGEEKNQFYGQRLDNLLVTTLPRVTQLNQRHCNKKYISTSGTTLQALAPLEFGGSKREKKEKQTIYY